MNTCTHCRTEIPTSATTCPNCLKNPYDDASIIWGWLVVIGAVALAFKLFF